MTVALLDRILKSGIDEVEFFCARQHLDYHNQSQIDELRYWFRDSDLKLHSIHSPLFSDDSWGRSGPHSVVSLTATSKARRIEVTDEIKRAIEIADSIPSRYLIQHVGMNEEEYDEAQVEAAFNCLDELIVFGKQLGVEILLENTPNVYSSARRLRTFVQSTHLPLSFCFDTGHAQLQGNVEQEFELMKDRIRSTHVHDNDGKDDSHLFPLLRKGGSIDWEPMMNRLRSLPGDVPLVMELREDEEMENALDDARRSMDLLEEL